MPSTADNTPKNSSEMLEAVEEEADLYDVFSPNVEKTIPIQPESPQSGKKPVLKTYNDIQVLIQGNRKRDVKQAIRENAWPVNTSIRAQLWPALCQQHVHNKSIQEGFYWDMVNSLFGTTGEPKV